MKSWAVTDRFWESAVVTSPARASNLRTPPVPTSRAVAEFCTVKLPAVAMKPKRSPLKLVELIVTPETVSPALLRIQALPALAVPPASKVVTASPLAFVLSMETSLAAELVVSLMVSTTVSRGLPA